MFLHEERDGVTANEGDFADTDNPLLARGFSAKLPSRQPVPC